MDESNIAYAKHLKHYINYSYKNTLLITYIILLIIEILFINYTYKNDFFIYRFYYQLLFFPCALKVFITKSTKHCIIEVKGHCQQEHHKPISMKG